MTEYKVGQRVKIGEWTATITEATSSLWVYLTHDEAKPYASLFASHQMPDAMGAVILPEPIEWKVGDYVEACGSGTIHRYQAHNDMFGAGGTQVARGIVEDGLKRGTWRRVAVTPID